MALARNALTAARQSAVSSVPLIVASRWRDSLKKGCVGSSTRWREHGYRCGCCFPYRCRSFRHDGLNLLAHVTQRLKALEQDFADRPVEYWGEFGRNFPQVRPLRLMLEHDLHDGFAVKRNIARLATHKG